MSKQRGARAKGMEKKELEHRVGVINRLLYIKTLFFLSLFSHSKPDLISKKKPLLYANFTSA